MRYMVLLASMLLAAAVTIPAAAPQQSTEMPLAAGPHRFTVDGIGMWYRVAGRPDGVPIVFLHGGPGEGSQVFQAIGGPALETRQRIIYYDQRGSGRSDRPEDLAAYSLAILVDDIERLREHLGVSKIALLGHSFGTRLGSNMPPNIRIASQPWSLQPRRPTCPAFNVQCAIVWWKSIPPPLHPPSRKPRQDRASRAIPSPLILRH